jgi:hypothetical protein
MSDQIKRSLTIIRNLPKHCVATNRRTGTASVEKAMNSCLDQVEKIKKQGNSKRVDKALVEAWRIYLQLQKLARTVREPFADNYDMRPDRTESIEDRGLQGPNIRSHGLGYRSVDWNAKLLMATHDSRKPFANPFWNEKEARKKHPVKHYTPEEIKQKFGQGT